jgi:Uma2 family endonuclease
MSIPVHRQAGYTIQEWKTWDGRWELIDGVAYDMTPSPSTMHQRISSDLLGAFWEAIKAGKREGTLGSECEVFAAPLDVCLGESVVNPDLLVVCDSEKIANHGIVGAPNLVIEICEERTSIKDLMRKKWLYEAAGVPEYLVVAPDVQLSVLYHLEKGRYVEASQVEWGEEVAVLAGRVKVKIGCQAS